MIFKYETKRTIKNVAILVGLFGALSFYGFNCAPPAFHIADNASSGDPYSFAFPQGPTWDTTPTKPNAVLTSLQVYESMSNLAGLSSSDISNTQVQEFTRREGAFPVSSDLTTVNAPMLLALTSYAGEVCNGLLTKEKNLTDTERQYLRSINLNGLASDVTPDQYNQLVSNLTNSFWGRAPSSEELAAFTSFRTDFVAAGNTTQTRSVNGLVVATCAGILSAFDVFTY